MMMRGAPFTVGSSIVRLSPPGGDTGRFDVTPVEFGPTVSERRVHLLTTPVEFELNRQISSNLPV